MGIARGAVALMLEEAARRPFHGLVGTLGRQTLYTTRAEVAQQFVRFKLAPKTPIDTTPQPLTDEDLFPWMGFDAVESLDYSDFEGATHVIDLNQAGVAPHLEQRYDVLLDSGTLEHVFHFPNALRNACSMVKEGGRVMILSPASNDVDHGFYMFSPTAYHDYFMANGFSIETLYLIAYTKNPDTLWEAFTYQPGQWSDLHIGGLDDRAYCLWVVATRLPGATLDVIPQQGFYARSRAAYAGSHLAGENRATTGIDATAQAQATPVETAGIARRIGRGIPGLRLLWHAAKRALWRVRHPFRHHTIFRKPLAGRY